MERAGVSTARKEELVKLAECCLHMFHSFPTGTADHLLRLPANNITPAERTRASMPTLPNADEFESGPPDVLREKMPEVHLSLILDWLVHACRHGDPPNGVFYRGVQRTMDSGGLAGLSIAAGLDSTVWFKLR